MSTPVLPVPGSDGYLVNLLTSLQNDPQHGFDFDSSVFIGVFMCLIASGIDMIVDVDVDVDDMLEDDDDDEDSGFGDRSMTRERLAMERVARMTQLICSNVFGLTTHHTQVDPSWSSQSPLTCLFNSNPSENWTPVPTIFREPSTDSSHYLHPYTSTMRRTRSRSRDGRVPSSSTLTHEEAAQSRRPLGRLASSTHTLLSPTGPAPPPPRLPPPPLLDPSQIPQVLILTGLEDGNRGTRLALASMLRSRQIRIQRKHIRDGRVEIRPPLSEQSSHHHIRARSGTFLDGLPLPSWIDDRNRKSRGKMRQSPLDEETREVGEKGGEEDKDEELVQLDLPKNFFCIWIRKMYRPKEKREPSWLIDRFTFKCRASINATRGEAEYYDPLPDVRLRPTIPADYLATLRSLSNKTHMHPSLRGHISNLMSAVQHHPQLESCITASSVILFKTFIRISRVLFRPFAWSPSRLDPQVKGREYDQRKKLMEAMERAEWYAIDEDVREVFGNLIEFRVNLRVPQETVMWPLKGGADGCELEIVRDEKGRLVSKKKEVPRPSRDPVGQAMKDKAAVQLILMRILEIV